MVYCSYKHSKIQASNIKHKYMSAEIMSTGSIATVNDAGSGISITTNLKHFLGVGAIDILFSDFADLDLPEIFIFIVYY